MTNDGQARPKPRLQRTGSGCAAIAAELWDVRRHGRTLDGRVSHHERAFKGEDNEHRIVGRPLSDLRIHSTRTRTSSTRAPEAGPRAQEVGVLPWHMENGRRD